MEAKYEIKKDTIIRTACLALSWVNYYLTTKGKSPLPISDAQVQTGVSYGLMLAATIWSWWKNNSFTQPALAGDVAMRAAKRKKRKLEDQK